MAQSGEDEFTEGFWKYDRFYGNWKPNKFHFPIDKEEMSRYDMFHQFFLLARNKHVFSYPMERANPRVLDLGTGTGIWAINVAEKYLRDAFIMAVDLNRIQPALIPPNLQTIQLDIEEDSWEPLLTDCDLVHLRLMLGSIHDDLWPRVYRKAFQHTTPGGYIEQVEIDWIPRWEGTERQSPSDLALWAEKFLQGMDGFKRSARVKTANMRAMMEAAGYVDFQERTRRCYVNPWYDDPEEQRVAQWFNLCLIDGLQAMSLAPMVEVLKMSIEDVNKLRDAVKAECCQLRYHAYCVMHIWTARKPRH